MGVAQAGEQLEKLKLLQPADKNETQQERTLVETSRDRKDTTHIAATPSKSESTKKTFCVSGDEHFPLSSAALLHAMEETSIEPKAISTGPLRCASRQTPFSLLEKPQYLRDRPNPRRSVRQPIVEPQASTTKPLDDVDTILHESYERYLGRCGDKTKRLEAQVASSRNGRKPGWTPAPRAPICLAKYRIPQIPPFGTKDMVHDVGTGSIDSAGASPVQILSAALTADSDLQHFMTSTTQQAPAKTDCEKIETPKDGTRSDKATPDSQIDSSERIDEKVRHKQAYSKNKNQVSNIDYWATDLDKEDEADVDYVLVEEPVPDKAQAAGCVCS